MRPSNLLVIACIIAQSVFQTAFAQSDLPVDKQATAETVRLYHSLHSIVSRGFLFGHQDDLAYGMHWKYIAGNSDVKEVTGDYPGVYGWELGRLELGEKYNLDSVPFDQMKAFIRAGYQRGGVITISWHLNNPLTGKSAWDPAEGTVASVLAGGEKHNLYISWLDKVADFMLSLRGSRGELIPVIFRPFHELNGGWFWWGAGHCSPDQIRQLYQQTVSYLKDNRQVHNLLYAYNTDRFNSRAAYLERYPGDQAVDLLGFDIYQRSGGAAGNEGFVRDLDMMLNLLDGIAAEKGKIPAITEFGYNTLPDKTWWTKVLLPAIGNHSLAYALAWRNAGPKPGGQLEFYVPFKEQESAADFLQFYLAPRTLFQKDVAALGIYR